MSNTNPDHISVVVPVFNAQDTLGEALESIRAQTFHNFELIIVNDGSSDSSQEIAESLGRRDPRIRILNQPNSGIVSALNRGLAEAKGRFVARMDADDISHPERFARQVSFLDHNPRVALIGTFYTELPSGKEMQMPTQSGATAAHLRNNGNAFVHSSVMIRSEACRICGGYRATFPHCEDYDLWLRIAEKFQVDNLPEYLIQYRRHAASVSQNNLEQQFLSALGARRCAALRRNGFPDPADGVELISVEQLERWGLRRDELCQQMIEWLEWNMSNLAATEEAVSGVAHISVIIEKYRSMRKEHRLQTLANNHALNQSSARF